MTTEKHTPGCVLHTGAVDNDGYGRVSLGGKWKMAHRVEWEKIHGPIPDGLQIDHLCRTRACINIAHMELVTLTENVLRGEGPTARNARKTQCDRGHDLAGDNLRIRPSGRRECIECQKQRWRKYRARKVQEKA